MVDRFSKLTRVMPIATETAEAVAAAFCDTWVASYGPPDTLLTDKGPQLASPLLPGVRSLNRNLRLGDWVFLDLPLRGREKLDAETRGPYQILDRSEHTFTVLLNGFPERVSGDQVVRAPTPARQKDSRGLQATAQGTVVPTGRDGDGMEFVCERFVDAEVDDEGHLWLLVRWWGYDESEDNWEHAAKFDPQRVNEFCERLGLESPEIPGSQDWWATVNTMLDEWAAERGLFLD
ncbi:hypothetical protein MMPV_001346 [Pyropia vietnamensis]